MPIKKAWIVEADCTACGSCADEAPEVFEVDDIAQVKKGIDLIAHEADIKNAAEICPAECIKYE